MLLADELRSLKEKLDSAASLKERAFFRFLIDDPLDYPSNGDLSEQEEVVFAAFCARGPKKKLLVEKLRGTKPIKGMHYSTNLIELAAFARFDLDKEIENLKNYAKDHSVKEFFVLKKLFPSVLDYPPAALKVIDHIALKLIDGRLSSNDKPAIASAIQDSEDLLDVFILHTAYEHLLDLQPATQYRRDARDLSRQLVVLIRRVDIAVRIVIAAITGFALYRLYRWIVPIIREEWNEVEPIAFIIQIVFWGVAILVLIVLKTQPDKLKFIKHTITFLVTVILRLMGINRREVENRMAGYVNKNDGTKNESF